MTGTCAPQDDDFDDFTRGIAWSHERVGEAIATLAAATDLPTRDVELPRLAPPDAARAAWLDEAILRVAPWLGVDAEAVGAPFADLDAMLAGASPAIVRVGESASPRLLALLSTTPRRAYFLAPDGAVVSRPFSVLAGALVPEVARERVGAVDAMLDRAGVRGERRPRARALLLKERFGHARVEGIWILRPPAGAPFVAQLRSVRFFARVAGLFGMQAAQTALFTASWWVLGATAFAGHLDAGWLAAWALLLVTVVPLHAAAARAEGTLAIDVGVLLKRRLLAGALAMDADATRSDGAGRMLARVLESQSVEQLSLDAGSAALFTVTDLIGAAIVLSLGAAAPLELALLAMFVVLELVLARVLLARRAAWTDARLGLTHDMTERLVGHRTRIAQERRDEWHDAEDEAVSRTVDASVRLDRVSVALSAALPRAWLVASVAGLAHVIVTGPREPVGVAVTLGGALVAFRALRRAAAGAGAAAGTFVAWKRVRPLFEAAAHADPPASPRVVLQREERARVSTEPLVEARELAFRYGRRSAPALASVSMRIAPREHVLLLGPSGGGKSTLGALVAGLRAPTSGLLLLDGLDGQTLGSVGWRRHVASAPQFHDNHVLGTTFAFNLLMGRAWPPAEADLVEAETICRELELGPLLDRMPAGLMQTVGETGWQLSHGERSRLYLARALLQRADLVVLDETFAALDPATLAKAVACARRRAPALLVIAHP